MKINVLDRISLLNILPQKGGMKTIILKEDIEKKIKVKQEELKKIDFVEVDGKSEFNIEKAEKLKIDLEFTNAELDLIKDALDKIDKQEEFTSAHVKIYNLFK